MIHSYSSPYNLGHKALENLWDGTVYVQEKIDGSQISFGVIDGELQIRSHNQQIENLDDAGMFQKAVNFIRAIKPSLVNGWTYRGEFLAKSKHNTLAYDHIPAGHIAIFDIDKGDQDYVCPEALTKHLIYFEVVPLLKIYHTKPTLGELEDLLQTKSFLGNTTVEGIVLKNYSQYGIDKKVLMAKLVNDAFKEANKTDWRERNPTGGDVVNKLIYEHATEARWNKAVQHLREQGVLQNAPQDIPLLLKEIGQDLLKEEGDTIKETLFKHYWKDIQRGITRGFPEWWKQKLAEEGME